MSTQPTLNHWIELLGLKPFMDDLFQGNAYLQDVRDELNSRREAYPSVSQDYIHVLNTIDEVLDEVEAQIDMQEQMVIEFNDAMAEAASEGITLANTLFFFYDRGRLLTQNEVGLMSANQQQLEFEVESIQDEMIEIAEEMESLQEEAEDNQREIENLQDDIKDIQIEIDDLMEDAETELEDAETELEDAQAALEALQEE